MKGYLVLAAASILLSSCVTTPPKKTVKLTNAKYAKLSKAAVKNAYDRDLSACKQLAFKNVPIPRSSTRRSTSRQAKSYGVYNSL